MVPSYRIVAHNRTAPMIDKETYPLCFAVRYKKGRGVFRNQFQKVEDDWEFIKQLIQAEDHNSLQFMEKFYAGLIKEGYNAARKDLFSTNNYRYSQLTYED